MGISIVVANNRVRFLKPPLFATAAAFAQMGKDIGLRY